jgi:hypothetical protein
MRLNAVLKSDDLMNHRIRVTDVADRGHWLADACRGRSVLHVGCCDVPIFDPNSNLHITLSRIAKKLDGLDISETGITELRRHVAGEFFTSPSQIRHAYDLVLVPEVLEHTTDPREFLDGVFGIRARRYLVTAPNIEWFSQTRRDGEYFYEQVHGDHRAWYSPYTLLNTLRPYISEMHDDVEVFLIQKVGSVAVSVEKPWPDGGDAIASDGKPPSEPARQHPAGNPIERAMELRAVGKSAEALGELAEARVTDPRAELFYLEQELLLELGRHLDAFRSAVAFAREHPRDAKCLRFCAAASEALGDPEQANRLRALAEQHETVAGARASAAKKHSHEKRQRRKR